MKTLEKHIVKYGLITTLALIIYFLVMRVAGLAEVTELRFVNALIMFTGIFLSVRNFRDQQFNHRFNYLSGIATGYFTGMVTGITFSLFVSVYMYFDPVLLAAIATENAQEDFLNPLTSGMVIFIEAIASGFLFAYSSMQYLKEDKIIPVVKAAK